MKVTTIDDVAIGSSSDETHADDLSRVLHCLHQAGLKLIWSTFIRNS